MPNNNPPIAVVPTFHHDIAYLQPEAVYTDLADKIIAKALVLMEEDGTYTFTVEQAYAFAGYWQRHPEQHAAMVNFAHRGQLRFAPSFWAVPDMCMPSGESLYMQATLGRRLLRDTVGARPQTALVADCWGHHAGLPQILTQCGYRYYTFSRCMERDFAVENFRWQGLDGSVINTHWMSTAYAGISFPDNAAAVNAEELHWEQASREGFLKLYDRNRAHCGNDPQIMPAGGDMKMPAASSPAVMRALQADEQMPPIGFSSFEQALDGIDFAQKPVYNKEFISSLKGTFATNIWIKQFNRQMESTLYGLEALSVQKNRPVDLTPYWQTALKNQFHDILCGTVCDAALQQVKAEYVDALAGLEQVRQSLATDGAPAYFNPLPFAVAALAEDQSAPCLLTADGLNYAAATPLPEKEAALPAVFENEWYTAALDARGFITRLAEKQTGALLADNPRVPFGSLLLQADNGDNWVEFEYPWEEDATLYTTNTPDPYDRSALPTHKRAFLARCGVQKATARRLGDEALEITQTGVLQYWITKIPFTTRVTLYRSSPRIEYHTEIDSTARRVRLRVAFPAGIAQGRVRHQIPFGLVERGEGPQPAGMLMDLQNETAGLALLNRGLPANNTEQGIMMLTLFRSVAMEYKCQSELSYNLGAHLAFDYALVPHAAGADETLWRQALAFNRPFVLTTRQPLAGFEVTGAQLAALRFDGDRVFMRLFNGLDKPVTARVRLPAHLQAYALADGLMEPEGAPVPAAGALTLPLGPHKARGVCFYKEQP